MQTTGDPASKQDRIIRLCTENGQGVKCCHHRLENDRMVSYEQLVELSNKSQGNYSLSVEELTAFVKAGAIRAYKAGDAARQKEDVVADFNPESKELRLSVQKKVVSEVKDSHTECLPDAGNATLGDIATLPVTDADTYKSIDAAVEAMRVTIESNWKAENVELIKTKFQEFKEHCLSAEIVKTQANSVTVQIGGVEAILPNEEQIAGELLTTHDETMVYVKELRQTGAGSDIIVSRRHPALVSHAMRKQIPEVDMGVIEIKKVARIAGNQSRVAVFSKDLGALTRCEDKADVVSKELGGEKVSFIEWYSDTKAFIVSSLKIEAREVHLIDSEKQALVEVFKDTAHSIDSDTLELAKQLTGFKIETKLVAKDASSDLPGI